MMNQYIQITEAFALANKGRINGCNMFNYATTIDGRFVCSQNSLDEFPEEFQALMATGWEPEPLQLSLADFPPDEHSPAYQPGQ